MPLLPEFRLVSYLSLWEREVRFPLSSSYPQSMTVGELLALAGGDSRERLARVPLDYPPMRGGDELRHAIAATYETVRADDICTFAGADEAIYALMHAALEPGDHAVVVTPCYQSLESLPCSLCAVSGVPLDPARGWAFDVDQVRAAMRPETRLVVVNFPHNPTGMVPPRETWDALVALCRERGAWLLSDEVYRLTEYEPAIRLSQAVDVYERGISLNVTSKAYGLPGLRLGWIAARHAALLARAERVKQYLSICNAAPSEALTCIALGARAAILERNMTLARRNLAALAAVMKAHAALFEWAAPAAGLLSFPRYTGPGGAEAFTARLVEATGVLLVPSTIYRSQLCPVPSDHIRVGFGREGAAEGLAAMSDWLASDR